MSGFGHAMVQSHTHAAWQHELHRLVRSELETRPGSSPAANRRRVRHYTRAQIRRFELAGFSWFEFAAKRTLRTARVPIRDTSAKIRNHAYYRLAGGSRAMVTDRRQEISQGRTALGIELGSTRIKAVLIGADHAPIAVGTHDWENQFVDRIWTYSLEAVWSGLERCCAALAADVQHRYDVELTTVGALGVSAMMHGYLAFSAAGELLTPFRTWRNTNTGEAAERLSSEFGYNIPHRWSVAHLYQAILNGEDHISRIGFLTTLAGYVHWQLTGEKVIGIGDASGMFPIDIATGGVSMLRRFDEFAAEAGAELSLINLLPTIRFAGEPAGELTEAGAKLLDPTGRLRAGSPLCPPEGDAGTGMVATNSIAPRTGNVSAGTSIFAMVVLEHELSRVHRELDLVTTPDGNMVAMVHCNNGASELNAWVGLFAEFAKALGTDPDSGTVFETLFRAALRGTPDCGGLMSYNYLSGEPITELDEGRPLFLRSPDSTLDLATFMRTQLFAALATLRIGMDVLQKNEGERLDRMFAHGGLFKTKGVAQRFLAAAIDAPVSVGDVAAEGGAWGIAVLAAFLASRTEDQSLVDFLDDRVFADATLDTIEPDPADVAGFDAFIQRFVSALPVEQAAIEHS
jgi:sugar (pentulose or hexulose) kinase